MTWRDEVPSLGAAADSGSPNTVGPEDVPPSPGSPPELIRQQAVARLRLLNGRVATLMWSTDPELRVTSCQAVALEELAAAAREMVGRPLADCIPGGPDSQVISAHRRALEQGEPVEYETEWLGRIFQARIEPWREAGGRWAGVVGVALDITATRRAQQDLHHSALRDGLTGLPNHTAFLDALAQAAARSERRPGTSYSVLLVNLDGFKAVNESLGHLAGDRVLIEVARRLEGTLRFGDILARFGGDEFTIVLEDVQGIPEPVRVAERIVAALSEAVELDGRQVVPCASVGVALAAAGQRPEDVLRDAETAMFRAKARGKGRYQVFDAALDARAMSLLRVEAELRRALEREDFRTHYAPTLAFKGGKVTGFEVLLWKRSGGNRTARS